MARCLLTGLVLVLLSGCGGAEREPAVTEKPQGTLVVLADENRLTTIDVASGRRATRRVRSLPPVAQSCSSPAAISCSPP